jgi:hypothetical protein
MLERWPKVVHFMSSMGEKYFSNKKFPTFSGGFSLSISRKRNQIDPIGNTYSIKAVTIINNKMRTSKH